MNETVEQSRKDVARRRGTESRRGAEVTSVFHSLIDIAKLARVDVREYLPPVACAAIDGRRPMLPGDLRKAR